MAESASRPIGTLERVWKESSAPTLHEVIVQGQRRSRLTGRSLEDVLWGMLQALTHDELEGLRAEAEAEMDKDNVDESITAN